MAGVHTGWIEKMQLVEAEIVENTPSGPYRLMKLRAPEIASRAHPGQFVMLRVSDAPDPLLRRPFSIHDVWFESGDTDAPAGILLLYHVVGAGTEMMAEMKTSGSVSVTGPLGIGFSACTTSKALLVAGGVGIAPLRFLGRNLSECVQRTALLAGARTSDEIHTAGFEANGEVTLTTDDGSKGIRGPVTVALEAALEEDPNDVTVYACGPKGMIARVKDLVDLYNVPCEVSLEAFMACGIGACYGCVVRATDRDGEPSYLRVCKEGPVFDSRRLISL
jgi:dihydroorotate dehydrogenase electron transfer subunit